MMILGCDQSFTGTGLTICNSGIMIHHEVFVSDVEQNIFTRIDSIVMRIHELIVEYKVKKIAIEGVAYMANGRIVDLSGLFHCILFMCRQIGVRAIVVPPKSLKKAATGNGNANKWLMLDTLPKSVYDEFMLFYKHGSRTAKKPSGNIFDVTDAYWLAQVGENL